MSNKDVEEIVGLSFPLLLLKLIKDAFAKIQAKKILLVKNLKFLSRYNSIESS